MLGCHWGVMGYNLRTGQGGGEPPSKRGTRPVPINLWRRRERTSASTDAGDADRPASTTIAFTTPGRRPKVPLSKTDHIRESAYYYWESSGRRPGTQLRDWGLAERSYRANLQPPVPLFDTFEGRLAVVKAAPGNTFRDWFITIMVWYDSSGVWGGICCEGYYEHNDSDTHEIYTNFYIAHEHIECILEAYGIPLGLVPVDQVRHMSPDELKSWRQERLRSQAYYHWEHRGRPLGDPMTDWLAARNDNPGDELIDTYVVKPYKPREDWVYCSARS